MADGPLPSLGIQLRRLIGRRSGCTLTDAQLLDDFVSRRDEAAFEVLVWRHGSMVLGVCQRILHDSHEAEDAFQATFLVFARKADSISKAETLGSWLYKVAFRVALRVRTRAAKRAGQEPVDDLPARETADEVLWRDLRPVLDEEIDRLPEKYRTPFVLCHLEGHTNEEAAELLGCPKGTILSRLARGRERLRVRLTQRGLALSAGALVLALSQNAAAVPAALVSATVEPAILFATGQTAAGLVSASVAALTEGVLHTMLLTKLKFATAALLALAVLGTGVGVVSYRSLAGTPDPVRPTDAVRAEDRQPEQEPQDYAAAPEEERRGEREARRRADLQGKVAAFDGKTLTLESGGGRGTEPMKTTIQITDQTKIEWTGPLQDLGKNIKVGDTAAIVLVEGSKDTAAAVQAQRKVDVSGKVIQVSADGKTLTFTFPGANRGEAETGTVMLTDKTKIEFVGEMKELGGKLKVGDTVSLWLADGSKEVAVAVQAQHGPEVVGKIAAISADGKLLTVEVPGPGRGEVTKTEVKLTDKTKTGLGGRGNELKPIVNFLVSVWLEPGSKDAAAAIHVSQPRADLSGNITAISADGKSVTVESKGRGGDGTKTEVKLDPATKIEFFGGDSKGKKLRVGYSVSVWMTEGKDSASLVLANVQRRTPDLGGTLSAVSADGKTITLENRKRGEDASTTTQIKLTSETEIDFAGTDKAEEKKLTVGYHVSVWLQDGSKDTAAAVHATKPSERKRERQ